MLIVRNLFLSWNEESILSFETWVETQTQINYTVISNKGILVKKNVLPATNETHKLRVEN